MHFLGCRNLRYNAVQWSGVEVVGALCEREDVEGIITVDTQGIQRQTGRNAG
jgi:hypothetical protein